VQPQRSPREVANVVAEQARRVLGTRHALVVVDGPGSPLRVGAGPGGVWGEAHERLLADLGGAEHGAAPPGSAEDGDHRSPRFLSAPLYDRSGDPVGLLAVGAKETGELTGDDEAILVSLAQMASVAIENAHLYETVRSGEERLLALVEAAPLAILDLGLDGEVRRANTAAQQLLGDPGAPGADTGVGFHPDTNFLLRRLVADTAAGGPVTDLEAVAWRSDGAEVPLSLAGAPLRDNQGSIDGVLVLATDVTARRRLEEQLVRARRIEAVGQMAGGVAHDFNNLLTVILGHASLLAGALPDDDARRADVEAISGAAERAAGITAQLLTISRGDLVSSEVFDVRLRLRHLAGMLRSFLPSSVELVMGLDAGEHLVRMSPAQFDQVILNLAVNARDAIGERGTLTVRLVGASESMTIEVIDTGAGMDPATAERCFEPFFTTKGGLRGTGLGLATVHSVVTGTGGDLTLTTTAGEGTTFRVRLPRAVGEAALEAAGDRPRGRRPGSERILLVEDEDGLRRLCAEVLRSAGYVVTPAADGQAALDLIDTGDDRPDLVVTDVVMPRVGGVELARRLAEVRPTLPVLFMTGYVDATSRPDLEGAEVLTKPFLVDELVDKVRQVLDRTGDEAAEAAGQGSKR
jgi:PAS domain S-box-containing protein